MFVTACWTVLVLCVAKIDTDKQARLYVVRRTGFVCAGTRGTNGFQFRLVSFLSCGGPVMEARYTQRQWTHPFTSIQTRTRPAEAVTPQPLYPPPILCCCPLVVLHLHFPDADNECIHTTESNPHNNGDSAVDKRVNRSNKNKPNPNTKQPGEERAQTQPATTARQRSDPLRTPRQHKHSDKHSTARYGCNGQAGQSGGCLETDCEGWERKSRQIHGQMSGRKEHVDWTTRVRSNWTGSDGIFRQRCV